MIDKKQGVTLLGAVALSLSLSACSVFDWLIYKPDVPQGNYMDQQQVEKLRIDMTKEQAEYVLGHPVLRDSFADNTWYYIYHYKSGRDASIIHKELILNFDKNKLVKVTGDYKLSESFDVPLGQESLPEVKSSPSKPMNPDVRPDAKPLVKESAAEPQLKKPIKNIDKRIKEKKSQ
ncbi:outer membrane protein assembly factor BamE [Shewanella sp. 202IG2-18]|uniref:outer membrane protein assembly factor BamE n=1 Tax=Parashewanella hymeniacidonis TaxID=2807618 RepID=UPI00195FC576|nr:outer membrane protein assembly factor BamE [Parashewanella hymeniacidonis]MBM7074411.1 outer membrane protein assembly factor BamE [Parashewanella hymeniacidonis]